MASHAGQGRNGDRALVDRALVTCSARWIQSNFIDFKRPVVYGILQLNIAYQEVINSTRSFYRRSQCVVKVDSELSNFFEICSRVRHSCVLLMLLVCHSHEVSNKKVNS